jgi:hypothetical protein
LVLWLARGLVVGGLAIFLVAPDVDGPVLVAVWLPVLAGYRFLALAPTSRAGKAAVDLGFLVLAFFAAFEGGWIFIPAGLCYLAFDVVGLRRDAGRQDLAVGQLT